MLTFFHFGQKSALLLLFFVHGLVFSALLLHDGLRNGHKSSLWLSSFIFLCCLYISPFMLGYAGWYAMDGYREALFYLPLQQLLVLGPVIYFYTRSLLNPDFRLSKSQWLHFLPAALYLLYSLIVWGADILVLDDIYFYADGRDKDLDPWYQVAGLVSMLFYFGLSLKHYESYKKLAFKILSFAETVVYRWVQRYLLAVLVILLLRILFFVLNPEWGEFGSKFWYYLCFSILFYYISITGYSHAVRTQSFSLGLSPVQQKVASINTLTLENKAELLRNDSKTSSGLEDLEQWKERLEQLMENKKLYINPGLTLLDLAEKLETTPRQISQIVNQGFDMNFNDFVNQYRTQAVIQKLSAQEHQIKTLLAIALECGFNSKSTFNRAFKQHTGLSPKKYLEKDT